MCTLCPLSQLSCRLSSFIVLLARCERGGGSVCVRERKRERVRVCVCVCLFAWSLDLSDLPVVRIHCATGEVCVRERDRERVCVCVREKARQRKRGKERESKRVRESVCVCVLRFLS